MSRTHFIENVQEIETIIRQAPVCFVGMALPDGTPYVLPMNFGYHEGVIYLHSAQEGKHVTYIEQNPRVCITFCTKGELKYQHVDVACSYSMKSKSVLCHGSVQFIESPDLKAKALNTIMHQYTSREFVYSQPALANTRVWRVKVEQMTGKSFGNQFKQ